MPDATLYTRLTTHAGLTALVSTRTYPLAMPQGLTAADYPLLVYSSVSDVPTTSLDWTIQFRESRHQISVFALTPKSARAVAEQVILALHGYVSGAIKKARYENKVEILEPGAGPDGVDLVHIPVDFIITH